MDSELKYLTDDPRVLPSALEEINRLWDWNEKSVDLITVAIDHIAEVLEEDGMVYSILIPLHVDDDNVKFIKVEGHIMRPGNGSVLSIISYVKELEMDDFLELISEN